MEAGSTYAQTLKELRRSRPRLAERLIQAEELRAQRLRLYLSGRRLAGLEQLYEYLERLAAAYRANDDLAQLAFLIDRVRADFVTALEATLSGFQGAAADAMRDVMETEYLLLDFGAHPGHLEEWLGCDRRLRLRKYSPGRLRDRLIAAGIPPFSDVGWEPVDYRAHSESLHVTPHAQLVAGRGIEANPDSLWADAGFIEMFEHAWRFIRASELLRHLRSGEPEDAQPLSKLDDFFDARDRTREMLAMIVAMVQGPSILTEKLGREPTAAELLRHVRDEAVAKGPRQA